MHNLQTSEGRQTRHYNFQIAGLKGEAYKKMEQNPWLKVREGAMDNAKERKRGAPSPNRALHEVNTNLIILLNIIVYI